MSHLYEVYKYISVMDNDQIKILGGAFGLGFPKLSRMSNPPIDVVAAWLRREDNVNDPPTWKSLIKALREVGQNGIAEIVEQDKLVAGGNAHVHTQNNDASGRSAKRCVIS